MNSFLIAAPSSGAGKTLVTLGLLRAFKNMGVAVSSAKAGPDYIDPAFHAVATHSTCINLDPWAMRASYLASLVTETASGSSHLVVEGMMGLYDGAADGTGSAADLAEGLGLPVILVVDVSSMSFSVAALVKGFRDHKPSLNFAGVILNKVGSPRHEAMLRNALVAETIRVFGAIPRVKSLELPSRHLGLVQAAEHEALEMFIEQAAETISGHCDLNALLDLQGDTKSQTECTGLQPLGQRIAIAHDRAFSFAYPHVLQAWQGAGAELFYFSPLEDEAPRADADAVFLPGGYPELFAEKLSNASRFKDGLVKAAKAKALIYGECGGYMVLGAGITDADGNRHAMAGLLRLETSFEERKLHLGYRQIRANEFVLGDNLRGHEFHYTRAVLEDGPSLFEATDAMGNALGSFGLKDQNVMGSYMHIIDRVS